jgi:general stress protein CsbA
MMRFTGVIVALIVTTGIDLILRVVTASALRNFTPAYSIWVRGIYVFSIAIFSLYLARMAWSDRTQHRNKYDILYVTIGLISIGLWASLRMLTSIEAMGAMAGSFAKAIKELGPFLLVTGASGLLSSTRKQ